MQTQGLAISGPISLKFELDQEFMNVFIICISFIVTKKISYAWDKTNFSNMGFLAPMGKYSTLRSMDLKCKSPSYIYLCYFKDIYEIYFTS